LTQPKAPSVQITMPSPKQSPASNVKKPWQSLMPSRLALPESSLFVLTNFSNVSNLRT
jgi:hypothetical protein